MQLLIRYQLNGYQENYDNYIYKQRMKVIRGSFLARRILLTESYVTVAQPNLYFKNS